MAKSKKRAKKPSFLSNFNSPKSLALTVFVLGFGAFGIYKLAFSSAAKPIKGSTQMTFVTKASEQVASQYNVGKLVKEKGVQFWRTNKLAVDPGYYVTNWRTPNGVFTAGPVGMYRVCFKFATSKPADVIFTLSIAAPNKGGSIEYGYSQISSLDRNKATCHDFNVEIFPSDSSLFTDLRITNDAVLEITESSVTKL